MRTPNLKRTKAGPDGVLMPRPHPPEFCRRSVDLARLREKPDSKIADDLGISNICLGGWMAQADIDDGPSRACRAMSVPSW